MSPEAYTEMAEIQRTHWWYAARRRILESRLRELPLPPGARILEIGSGTGANLDLLAEFGDVVGLEMSTRAIELARQQVSSPRVRMGQGLCQDDLARVVGHFNLMCLVDVLDQLEDAEVCISLLSSLV